MDAEREDPYLLAIEETFNRRRGAPHLLSPRDWALADSWRRSGVPLRLVLQGIENCFDAFERRAPGPRRINSLSYCRQEILGLHDLYVRLHGVAAGRPAPSAAPEEAATALAKHLGRLLRRLRDAATAASGDGRDALVGPLAETIAELRRLKKGLAHGPADPAAVEASLDRLDAALLDRAREVLTGEELRAIDAAVEAALSEGAARMTGAALETTRAAARSRRIRQAVRLPRLSLFD